MKVVLACATQFFIPTALLVYHYTIIHSLAYSLTDSLLLGDQDAKVTLRRLSDALGKVRVVLVYLHHHHHQGALRAGRHLRHRRPPTKRTDRGGGLTLTLTLTRTRTRARTLTLTLTLTVT